MSDALPPDGADRDLVGWHYEQARQRLDAILRRLDTAGWETPVAACPGWRVRDVLAHMVGIIEDAAAGVISGPPNEEQTAAEVDRHRDDDPLALLDQWAASAPLIIERVSETETWPAAYDVTTHEHDVRAALGQPGARDHESLELFATQLFARLKVPLALTVDVGTRDFSTGGTTGSGAPALKLKTTSFDFFRLRLGRRTRDEVLAMDWSADPSKIVDHLFVFGPTEVPVGD